jgi:hypothetical protein
MRYFILDIGKDMIHFLGHIETYLKTNNFHYIVYMTDNPTFLGLEEVTDDEFLDHYKNTLKDG